MSKVDNRIVNMVFDNQKFEKGVQTSIKSLEALKKSLNLEGAAKGLQEVDVAARGISLATLSNGVESITVKFSALGVMALTTLYKITDAVLSTAKNLMDSFTIDPIIEGFQEYELKMDSVQTIMNGTGATLEMVSERLDELNTYADRTIYSFQDMTSNIGKFTNAGVGLDDAVGAIQGVSNAAALSGANATQASHAMYNFAQALAAGHIKLIDWKSIETANMATVEFKNQLLESAVAAGTLSKSADGMYTVLTTNGSGTRMKETISATQNFNDSLAYQWMTTETLISTLNDYADETTEIGKRAFQAATEVKTFTQLIDTMQEAVGSGWAQTWEILIGNFDEAKEVLTEMSQAFDKIVDASADSRNKLLQDWKDLGGRKALIDAIRNVFVALSIAIGAVKDAFSDIFPAKTADQLMSMTETFKEFTERLKMSEDTAYMLTRAFKGLFAILDIFKMGISAVLDGIGEFIGYSGPATKGILALAAALGDFVVGLRDVIKESQIFNRIIDTIGKVVYPAAEFVKDAFYIMVGAIAVFVDAVKMPEIDKVGERLERGFKPFTMMASVIKGVTSVLKKFVEVASPIFGGLGIMIGKGLAKAQEAIMNWLNNVNFSAGLDIFNAGLFAAILLGVRKFVKGLRDVVGEVDGVIGSIGEIISGITGVFQELQSNLRADTLIKIAKAIAILTASVVVLSMIDSGKLTLSLGAIAVLFGELMVSMAMFDKVMTSSGFRSMSKIVTAMIGMSVAVLILSSALKKMADLKWSELLKGLAGVAGLMTTLIATIKLMPSDGKVIKGAGGLILFASAINILASAVKKLGSIETSTLIKGLIGVGVLLTELSLFMSLTDFDGMGLFKGLGIMAMATALVILASAVKKLGEIDTGAMIQGLIGVGVVLAELSIFMNVTGDATKVISTAVGLTILGTAMLLFAKVIDNMGGMSWEEIAKGLITMAGALTVVTTALHFIQGAIGGAAALLIVAGSLMVFIPVLKILGNMEWLEIGKGLLALAGTFTVIGVAAMLLAPASLALLGLAASITALGVAVALIGGGILALSAGLTALGVAGSAGVAALVLAITGLIGLIPMFLQQIANGIVAFANIIAEGAPAIVGAISAILISILQMIKDAIPEIVATGIVLFNAFIDIIVAVIPRLAEVMTLLLTTMLDIIVAFIPKVVEAIGNLVKELIRTVKDLLGIRSPSNVFIEIGKDIIAGLIQGLTSGVRKVVDTIGNVASSVTNTFKKVLGIRSPSVAFYGHGASVVQGLVNGMDNNLPSVRKSASGIANTAQAPIDGKRGAFWTTGKDLISNFINGMNNRKPVVASTTEEVADAAIRGMKKSEQAAEPIGEKTSTNMAKGIEKGTPKVKKAAGKKAKTAYEATKEWIDKQKKYHDLSLDAELSKWNETLKKYKEGQDEYYEILNHIADVENRKRQESFDYSKNWIAKEKEMKRISLFEELEAWERVQARYAEGTDQRIEADKEVQRVRTELVEAMRQIDQEYYTASEELNKKLIEDIEEVTEAYEKAVDDRAKAIFNSFGLFDEVTDSEEVSGRDLIRNLQDQVTAIDFWASEFERLSKKGIEEGLLEELRNMGPKSLPQLQALNKLTDTELSLYSELWKTKMVISRTQAEKELVGLKEDSEKQIEELKKKTDDQLEELKKTWKTKTEQLVKATVDEYKVMGNDIIKGLRELRNKSKSEIEKSNEGMKTAINSENWEGLGKNIVEGISDGLGNNASLLLRAMTELATQAKQTMEKELGIQSPSRVFMEIGKQTILGLVQGVSDKKSYGLISDTIRKIGDMLNEDMSMTPTIRPVIDLADVKRDIDSAFGSDRVINTSSNLKNARDAVSSRRTVDVKTDVSSDRVVEINNEFVIHATIREEADIRKLSQDLHERTTKTGRGRGVLYDRF